MTSVLIVGAGPTGLTAAIELARRGLRPAIIDRRDSASTFSRAVGITPRSLELLAPSGVSERLIREGVAMEAAHIYLGTRLALTLPLHSPTAFFPTLLCLPQDRTETLIAEALAKLGVEVRYGTGLESIDATTGGLEAILSNGKREHADILIGADGVRSTVREAAGIAFPGQDLDEVWSIADVESPDWRHPRAFTLVLTEGGAALVVVPMAPCRYRLVANTEDALATLPLPFQVSSLRRQGTFTISVRQAETYSRGRIFLAGDAAHCHAPIGGRGMNLGIADAAELARRILDGGLEGYASRHAEGAQTIRTTERGRRLLSGEGRASRWLLGALLAMVNHLGPVKRRLGRFMVEF